MSTGGRPRTKPDTEAIQADRDYYKRYQAAVKARQQAAKVKAARPIAKTMFTLRDVQDCPVEKMAAMFKKMGRV